MKFLFLVTVVSAANYGYPCPTGTERTKTSNDPTEANCCEDFFDCSTTTKCDDDELALDEYFAEDSQVNCCTRRTCDSLEYECPSGEGPNNDYYGTAISVTATDELCCEDEPVWDSSTATCQSINAVGSDFACAVGTLLVDAAYSVSDPTQAVCCVDHVPTCYHKSGTEAAPVSQTCGSDEVLDSSKYSSTDPTEEACCTPFIASCSMIDVAGNKFKCAAGSIEKEDTWFSTSGDDVDATTCCSEEQTCSKYTQQNCGSYAHRFSSLVCDSGDVVVLSNLLYTLSNEGFAEECCVDGVFSAAASVVASLTFLVVLL